MRHRTLGLAVVLCTMAACAPDRSTAPDANTARASHKRLSVDLTSPMSQKDSLNFEYIWWAVPSGATSWTASLRFHIYQYGRDSLGHDNSHWSWKVDPLFTSSSITSYYDNNPRHTWTDNNYCSDSNDDFEAYAYYWVIFSYNGLSQKDTATTAANFISTNPDSCAISAH